MQIIEIEDISDPRVRPYVSLTDSGLRNAASPIFIAESPKVIMTALDMGYKPLSLLCERRHIEGDAAAVIDRGSDLTVYTGSRETLEALTGYKMTRGVLAVMERRQLPTVADVCRGARRIVVLDGVCDTTNTGAIFRSAVALGVDGVILSTGSCDPLNRRAQRVSMGTVLRIPWTFSDNPVAELRQQGFTTVAMALRHDAMTLDDPRLRSINRLALVMGTEGDGLSDSVIADCDLTVIIPMARGVDSLNVAAATAVAVYALRPQD